MRTHHIDIWIQTYRDICLLFNGNFLHCAFWCITAFFYFDYHIVLTDIYHSVLAFKLYNWHLLCHVITFLIDARMMFGCLHWSLWCFAEFLLLLSAFLSSSVWFDIASRLYTFVLWLCFSYFYLFKCMIVLCLFLLTSSLWCCHFFGL